MSFASERIKAISYSNKEYNFRQKILKAFHIRRFKLYRLVSNNVYELFDAWYTTVDKQNVLNFIIIVFSYNKHIIHCSNWNKSYLGW